MRNKPPFQLAEILLSKLPEERLEFFNSLTHRVSVKTFEYLPFEVQKQILNGLTHETRAKLLNDLSPDDRTAFLEELPSQVVNQLIKRLSPKERALTLQLLGYPEDSVGRLMTPDYLSIKMDWTVKKVLEYVRKYGHNTETVDVLYIVDDEGRLIDDIRIKEFLFAPLSKTVSEISDRSFIALSVLATQEEAVQVFRKYSRVALPVVDPQGVLLGIVTIDDILSLMEKEDTADIQKMGGTEALEAPYLQTPFFELIRKRAGWLTVLFLGEMLTASAMGYFETEIAQAVVLALFIPLIISSGGNSGSQASTLIIRAMALGEVKLKDWWRISKRELFSGLLLGASLGVVGFLRVSIWSLFSPIYGEHWLLIAWTIFFALTGVVCLGTLTGSMLPFILRRFKLDPATCSAPFVATIVDVAGIVIYFSIALVILRGTIL